MSTDPRHRVPTDPGAISLPAAEAKAASPTPLKVPFSVSVLVGLLAVAVIVFAASVPSRR